MANRKLSLFLFLLLIVGVSVAGILLMRGINNYISKDNRDDGGFEIVDNQDYNLPEDDEEVDLIPEEDLRRTVFYFRDKSDYIVPIMMKIPKEEGIAKATLSYMVDSEELRAELDSIGLLPTIPAGTQIRGMSISDEGVCKVDFTKEFLEYTTESEEEGLIKGVTYTLTEFDRIKEVLFMVEGKSLDKLKFGTDLSNPIKREDINLVGNTENERSRVVVYLKSSNIDNDFEYYIPVTIPTLSPIPNIFTALDTLFNNIPYDLSLSSDIPEGVSFHGVDIQNNVAFVDITLDVENSIETKTEYDNMIKSIGLTLKNFHDVEKVELLIDGKTLDRASLDFDIEDTIPTFANEY